MGVLWSYTSVSYWYSLLTYIMFLLLSILISFFFILIGHSLGEIAAAYICGVFTLEDAIMIVIEIGKLMSELPSQG